MGEIKYKEFYGNTDSPFKYEFESPTVSIFFNERKKLFLSEFKKLRRRKDSVRVLDVGAGWGGSILSLFKISRRKDSFLGIDINSNMGFIKKDMEKKGIDNVDFNVVDLSKSDWADDVAGEFDMIIFSETIEHLYPKDQENALKNISKKLANDGVLIITCPNKGCLIKKIISFGNKIPYLRKKIKIELKGSEGHVAELSYMGLRNKSSEYFDKIKHGGFTFTYGHNILDDNNFMTILFLLSNSFFRYLFPFWCFDQYITLKNKE
jgi:2-polyprenyl-3-methyl-5-hydroxy-6-metoxy-1,4-benzoquinol methylase